MNLDSEKDLKIERILDVEREKLWACWTHPEHIQQFFIPKPHQIEHCEIDLKVGGKFNTVFQVEGNRILNNGVYLEIVEGRKLVFTDGYTEHWTPSEHPFMTAIILFEDVELGKTKYTAIARHATAEARHQHEQMGFYQAWGIVIDQLEAYAKTI